MAKQTKGFCKYCGNEYTRSGMLKHLGNCKKRATRLEQENGETGCGYFQLLIRSKYRSAYWLIVEMKETAALQDLDQFIRDIWVECCGHLSEFEIDDQKYESCPNMGSFWGTPPKDLKDQVKKLFRNGQVITYKYDFGSTTTLLIEVQGYRLGDGKAEKITILSRNNPPEILCSQCGEKQAKWVDVEGYYDGTPYWCEECMDERNQEWEDEDAFILPICNSPRMGTCGYSGSDIYPEQFLPEVKKD